MEVDHCLKLVDLCQELGLQSQFLIDLAGDAQSYYKTFNLPKRSGGARKISASVGRLKRTQRLILDGILSKLTLPAYVHGCVKGRSIVTNAQEHVNQPVVINIDLSNFFGTITFDVVRQIYETTFNFDQATAELLTQLTTYNECLPQGAPTSPILANVAALGLDKELLRTCSERVGQNEFRYSRYVDDITISGADAIISILPDLQPAIERCGFQTNPSKTRILRASTRQWVTGVVVNKRVNPPKKLIRKIRQHLYYCEKWGVKEHCETHGITPRIFWQRTTGLIAYVRLTRPELADEFMLTLNSVMPRDKESNEDEDKIRFLKRLIDDERQATFMYDKISRKVVPVELNVDDDDGRLALRAFELSPEQCWNKYYISDITELNVDGATM